MSKPPQALRMSGRPGSQQDNVMVLSRQSQPAEPVQSARPADHQTACQTTRPHPNERQVSNFRSLAFFVLAHLSLAYCPALLVAPLSSPLSFNTVLKLTDQTSPRPHLATLSALIAHSTFTLTLRQQCPLNFHLKPCINFKTTST